MVTARATIFLLLSASLGPWGCGSSKHQPPGRESTAASPAKSVAWIEAAGGARYLAVAGGGRIYQYPAGTITYDDADSGPCVVTVTRPLTEADRAALGALGVTSGEPSYRGDRQYLFRLDAKQRAAVLGLDFVTGVAALQPADKLDPDRLGGGSGPVTVTVDLVPVSPAEQAAIAGLCRAWGATLHFADSNTLRLTIDRARLGDLERISDVIWIEPTPPQSPPVPSP